MKSFTVRMTPEAVRDVRRYIAYLQDVKMNEQAAQALFDDYRETKKSLAIVANSLPEPTNKKLRKRGLKRINFQRHDYFMLYRINGDVVEITNMFHTREDYEKKI